jgi:hypothetical protein
MRSHTDGFRELARAGASERMLTAQAPRGAETLRKTKGETGEG